MIQSFCSGVNHKTTPLEVREKMALSEGYENPLQQLGAVKGLKEYYLLVNLQPGRGPLHHR